MERVLRVTNLFCVQVYYLIVGLILGIFVASTTKLVKNKYFRIKKLKGKKTFLI